jgi:hypothetical protein
MRAFRFGAKLVRQFFDLDIPENSRKCHENPWRLHVRSKLKRDLHSRSVLAAADCFAGIFLTFLEYLQRLPEGIATIVQRDKV